MVLDRRSLSYAAIGLSPSWMLLDLEVRPAAADSNVSFGRGRIGCGAPKSPFVHPETGLGGEGSLSLQDALNFRSPVSVTSQRLRRSVGRSEA